MFKVLVGEKTFDHRDGLPAGVTITMRPVNQTAKDLAKDAFDALAVLDGEIVEWDHPDTQEAVVAYDVALMAACVVRWTGIGDHTGENPLAITIEGTRAVMAQDQIYLPMVKGFAEPFHFRTAEKNGYTPSPSGPLAEAVASKTSKTSSPQKLN